MSWKTIQIFFIGVIFGIALTFLGLRYMRHQWQNMSSEQRFDRMLHHFSHRLRLDPEQEKKVAAILQANRQKMDALITPMKSHFEALRDSTQTQIRAVLSPKQQEKFDAICARERKHHNLGARPWLF